MKLRSDSGSGLSPIARYAGDGRNAADCLGMGVPSGDTPGLNVEKTASEPASPTAIPQLPDRENLPVTCVSRHEAQAFADWLSWKSGETIRLPTSLECLYACQAGKTRKQYFDELAQQDHKQASPKSNVQIQVVGTGEPNAFGVYDMNGNVYEWLPRLLVGNCWTRQGAGSDLAQRHSLGGIRLVKEVPGTSSTDPQPGFRYDFREKDRLEGHQDAVYSVAFTPDNAMLVSAGRDKVHKTLGTSPAGAKFEP